MWHIWGAKFVKKEQRKECEDKKAITHGGSEISSSTVFKPKRTILPFFDKCPLTLILRQHPKVSNESEKNLKGNVPERFMDLWVSLKETTHWESFIIVEKQRPLTTSGSNTEDVTDDERKIVKIWLTKWATDKSNKEPQDSTTVWRL